MDGPVEVDVMDVGPSDAPGTDGDGSRLDGARVDVAPYDAATGMAILAFCDEEARAVCAQVRACGSSSTEEAFCAATRRGRCRVEAEGALIPGVAGGRVQFDADAAARWVASVDAAVCGQYNYGDPPEIFRGFLPDGAPCVDRRECAGGICDRATTCPGVCGSPAGVGGSCSPFGCDGSQAWCGSKDGETCVPIRPPGSPCGIDATCGDVGYCGFRNLPCAETTGSYCTCALYGQAGESCRSSGGCARGLGCAEGRCRPLGQKGEWCDGQPRTGCASGLVCAHDGTGRRCAEPLTEGGRCFGGDCARGLFCVFSPPNPTSLLGVCRRPAALGERCPDEWPCAEGTYCGVDRTCVAGAKLGEACLFRNVVPDVDVPGDDCSAAPNHCRVVKATCAGEGVTCSNRDGGTCVVLPAVGQPCSLECASGELICRFVDGLATCRADNALGQLCGQDLECASRTCIRNACAPPCTAADL